MSSAAIPGLHPHGHVALMIPVEELREVLALAMEGARTRRRELTDSAVFGLDRLHRVLSSQGL